MLKVGLIGCGFMGAMHANCYKNIEGAEVVAFADVRREKAEALAKGTNAVLYGDGKDLIAQADVDIIDICFIILRQKHLSYSGSVRSKHLLSDTANRQDFSSESYFSCHSHIFSYRSICKC